MQAFDYFSNLVIRANKCFITILNTEKRVENTTRSGVFLTNLEVFDPVIKYIMECLMLLLKQNGFFVESKQY